MVLHAYHRLNYVQDWILDIQMHKKLAEQQASSKDNSISAQTSLLYSKIRNLSKRQMKLDAKLDTFGLQMNVKFELMSKILAADPSKDRTAEELAVLEKAELSIERMNKVVPKAGERVQDVLAEWNTEIISVLEESASELAADVEQEAAKVVAVTTTDDMRALATSQTGLNFEIQSDASSDDDKSVMTGRDTTDQDDGEDSSSEDEKQKANALEAKEGVIRQEKSDLISKMRGSFVQPVQQWAAGPAARDRVYDGNEADVDDADTGRSSSAANDVHECPFDI
jgi:hypothetical protein